MANYIFAISGDFSSICAVYTPDIQSPMFAATITLEYNTFIHSFPSHIRKQLAQRYEPWTLWTSEEHHNSDFSATAWKTSSITWPYPRYTIISGYPDTQYSSVIAAALDLKSTMWLKIWFSHACLTTPNWPISHWCSKNILAASTTSGKNYCTTYFVD